VHELTRNLRQASRRRLVKNAALQCNYLNPGNVWVSRNRLCTELSTEMGDMSKSSLGECVGRTLTSLETQSPHHT
jgi:hypothetical protein